MVALMVAAVVVVLASGSWFYLDQNRNARRAARNQLVSIAELKVNQIAQWRSEKLADARVISGTSSVAEVVSRWLETGESADREEILDWLGVIRDQYHYADATLVDPLGKPLLTLGDGDGSLTEVGVLGVLSAAASAEPVLTDLHFDINQTIHIDTIAPLFTTAGRFAEPLGAVVLHQPAAEFLYPLIQSWPTPSETAETLLVRREGDGVLFLNELRFERGTALKLSFPLSASSLPAVMAVEGTRGLVEAPDYRGVPVLAEVQPIPGSPWFMVAKIDVSEALSGTLLRSGLIFGLIGVLLAAVITGSLLTWQWGLKRRLQHAYAVEVTRRGLLERFEHVVRQAGDVILLADENLHIVEANDRAVQVYGYLREELLSMRILDLLPSDGLTGFSACLAEAEDTQGTIHETVHRRKCGAVFPVEVSDRKIVLEGRAHYQAIVRDITGRKQAEDALRESEERYRVLAEENERLYRQQLEIADDLQLAFLHVPTKIGPLRMGHLYRSATEAARVGGDFYDVFEVKQGRVAMLVGDVAGHGVQAARVATLVKDVVHAFVHQSPHPGKVFERTNRLLLEKKLPQFVTAFLGVLDLDTGLLRYGSAGHPEILVRSSSRDVRMLKSGSSPLGVFADASWGTEAVVLKAGDLLLLYTDGVIETRRDGDFFGEERLRSLLGEREVSPESLPTRILDRLLAFSEGYLADDVAILAVQLSDGVE